MNKKEIENIMNRLEQMDEKIKDLTRENKKLKEQKKEPKKESWETIKTNTIIREDRPCAYGLIQKNGRKKRIVIGGYCRIARDKLKGDVQEYYVPTEWKDRKGKKVTGHYVPMKKGSIILSKKEKTDILKGF